MILATCHCGAVRIEVADPPSEVADCNCSICRRYGTLWAYYTLDRVTYPSEELTETYLWGPRETAFHRCRTCGCVTHWRAVDPDRDWTGVNARLMPPEVLAAARLRHLDCADTGEYLD